MADSRLELLASRVRDVPDFPKPGIVFKDITPVLSDPEAFQAAVGLMAEPYENQHIDVVLGIESRGFILGAPIALELGASFVPVRKPGKLPAETDRVEYELEYGTDAVEVHTDALYRGARVLLVDDVIATGGTAAASIELARRQGAEVIGAAFLMELTFLNGTDKLGSVPYTAALAY